jgi:Uma2 family endonuclease
MTSAADLRHREAPAPLHFPSSATMLESKRHLTLRTFLYQVLKLEVAARSSVGSEQFVYWNARDPKRCVAPDVFVKLRVPDGDFDVWKTWNHGAPELCVEIVSPSDEGPKEWRDKLERYDELGVSELVRFDADAEVGRRLMVWDRIEGRLVEREVVGDATPCVTLGLHFYVGQVESYPAGLRIARDAAHADILASPEEIVRAR